MRKYRRIVLVSLLSLSFTAPVMAQQSRPALLAPPGPYISSVFSLPRPSVQPERHPALSERYPGEAARYYPNTIAPPPAPSGESYRSGGWEW